MRKVEIEKAPSVAVFDFAHYRGVFIELSARYGSFILSHASNELQKLFFCQRTRDADVGVRRGS